MFGGFDRRELRLLLVILLGGFAAAAAHHWAVPRKTPVVELAARTPSVPAAVQAPGPPQSDPASEPPPNPEGEVALAPFQGGRIDLNTATQEELEMLPLVGPAKARAIIEERESGGLFRSVDEIVRVPGFGEKTRDRLAPFVVVSLPEGFALAEEPDLSAGSAVGVAAVQVVRVNHATATDYERLVGVGPVMAARLLEDRRLGGPFRSPEELMRVKGFGPKTLEKNRHLIVVD